MNIRPMTDVEKRAAAKGFVETWTGRGDEKQDAQNFWRQLLSKVYGVEDPESDVLFEYPIKKDEKASTIFIDAYIKDTSVLIEQKGKDINLSKHYEQSDGAKLTPYGQARRYAGLLPHNMNPRWIVVSNFQEFRIHDMNYPNAEPYVVMLADLEKEYHRLNFLVNTGSENLRREFTISKKAGDLVGLLYDALLKQYKDPSSEKTLKSLNALCVRIVFCLYAEDAGIFGQHLMFHDYVQSHTPQQTRKALVALFRVLDQKPDERDPYLSDDDPLLAAFPYVNGGLFSDENIEIPPINDEIYHLILRDASEDFDWSEISPTIFGAMFESTLNPAMRRQGGMHYTTIENIHKVIDPLFLDDLKAELNAILAEPIHRTKSKKLSAFQDKLASLVFLDPAAGSGNFLTESYLSLRRLENRVILEQTGGQIMLGVAINPIKVSITQFHGIEINDFAVTVARTALWIAESQMMKETEDIVHMDLDFLPLKTQANIVEGNALRLDWNDVVDKTRLSYIMGNPPFGGQQRKTVSQSEDMALVWGKGTPETKLDYVMCWYYKALQLMNSSLRHIKCGLVSTDSICEGECVPTAWHRMSKLGMDIFFAYRSFKWTSDSTDEASVLCVIIGFTNGWYTGRKYIYTESQRIEADRINAYLIDAPDLWITSRINVPANGLPKMVKGSEPTDGGDLFFTPEQRAEIVSKYSFLDKYILPFIGGDEYINNRMNSFSRYCFWLGNGSITDCYSIPELKERFLRIANKRKESSADRIQKRSLYPYLFCQIRQPKNDYLVFPQHSTSSRKYIPIGFMPPNVIVGNACYIIPDTDLYLFGILTSNVHMAWTSLVCGRLGKAYRYSPSIYNNFPWPSPTDAQRQRVTQTAQAILEARNHYPDASLAALYGELTMPPELRKAHQQNDLAVLAAYGIKKGDPEYSSESACVAMLMRMYQEQASR